MIKRFREWLRVRRSLYSLVWCAGCYQLSVHYRKGRRLICGICKLPMPELTVIHGRGLMPNPYTHPFARIEVDGEVYIRAFTRRGRRYWILESLLRGTDEDAA